MITFGFDIETTGLDPFQNEIITIRYRRGGDNFVWKSWDYGSGSEAETRIILEFLDKWQHIPRKLKGGHGDIFVGFNVEKFDVPFLLVRAIRLGIGGRSRWPAARRLWHQSRSDHGCPGGRVRAAAAKRLSGHGRRRHRQSRHQLTLCRFGSKEMARRRRNARRVGRSAAPDRSGHVCSEPARPPRHHGQCPLRRDHPPRLHPLAVEGGRRAGDRVVRLRALLHGAVFVRRDGPGDEVVARHPVMTIAGHAFAQRP